MPTPRNALEKAKKLQKIREAKKQQEASHVVSEDFRLIPWMSKNLIIRPKTGTVCKLIPNPAQRKVNAVIVRNRYLKKPSRIIVLKSRQLGCSTDIQGINFSLIHNVPHRSAQTIAHKRDSVRKIHRMAKRFYYGLPDNERHLLEGGKPGKDSLIYAWPHDSEISVYTAGSDEIGRGETVFYNHWSEFAFWPNAESLFDALMQTVPSPTETWDTVVVIESTANGQENLFYKLWQQAQDPASGWTPIFLSWLLDPRAWMEIGPNEKFIYTPEEEDYAKTYNLPPQRVKWARYMRENQCRGNWDKFHQEYPVSPELAFMFSGWPWFDPAIMQTHLDTTAKATPLFNGELDFGAVDRPIVRLVA